MRNFMLLSTGTKCILKDIYIYLLTAIRNEEEVLLKLELMAIIIIIKVIQRERLNCQLTQSHLDGYKQYGVSMLKLNVIT